eukprot:TRINITY_DN30296_c0_g1_i1.p1 TRINITY_DN30296_c0_g1~~TRINITY_DN30296_c0_g1_i1.p1  ORF type:complete len:138 (-),score=7.60 TRINITY_DN30296_c0_g1_i1:54-443(-)
MRQLFVLLCLAGVAYCTRNTTLRDIPCTPYQRGESWVLKQADICVPMGSYWSDAYFYLDQGACLKDTGYCLICPCHNNTQCVGQDNACTVRGYCTRNTCPTPVPGINIGCVVQTAGQLQNFYQAMCFHL